MGNAKDNNPYKITIIARVDIFNGLFQAPDVFSLVSKEVVNKMACIHETDPYL
jgi:hypothetical protein